MVIESHKEKFSLEMQQQNTLEDEDSNPVLLEILPKLTLLR